MVPFSSLEGLPRLSRPVGSCAGPFDCEFCRSADDELEMLCNSSSMDSMTVLMAPKTSSGMREKERSQYIGYFGPSAPLAEGHTLLPFAPNHSGIEQSRPTPAGSRCQQDGQSGPKAEPSIAN